ncbi:hypothetical protein OG607_04550 [Streptomyces sp. NBC_01537]|uniref:hypothetical protein n=1 Tax=Streptomyces sp. NBC_01537 TaxID=2903896 RepID=UPI00386715C3
MTAPDFRPTHVAPAAGLPAWAAPGDARPSARLDPLLPVQLLDRRGDWGHIVCSNGWSAWVDGRLLVTVPQGPPAAPGPAEHTADARPLLARLEQALSRYRQLTEELAAGRIDGETFQRRTQGERIGAVVDGEAIWLFDTERERWCYCEGASMARLTTYAAVEPPSTEPSTLIDRPRP